MSLAYYNEIDPYAAQWLRNLITAGHIANGYVDERSIEDVRPADLAGFTQCHFFAGIGVWSYSARNAGWPDDRPLWTASCPCQPFSTAGKGAGFADERHLWPHLFYLIEQCRPFVIIGEQVASKDAESWLDLVQDDLEGLGYAFGACAFPSASVGAPHIRDRTYWVAYSNQLGAQRTGQMFGRHKGAGDAERDSATGRMANGKCFGHEEIQRGSDTDVVEGRNKKRSQFGHECGGRTPSRMGDTRYSELSGRDDSAQGSEWIRPLNEPASSSGVATREPTSGPTNGYWRDADWLYCRDAKWRSVEPGTFPLAHGVANRMGRLRAYGNAINAEQAKIFIEVAMECMP